MGTWALPGGWCDVLESVKSNTIKEAKEETGLDVQAVKVISIQDRNKHNKPIYAYGICKVFVLCDIIGGGFIDNIETTETKYFSLEDIPTNLAEEKTNNGLLALKNSEMDVKTLYNKLGSDVTDYNRESVV